MPSDPVELTKQIKAASDIVTVVGTYLAVKPAGAIFKALCPFHNDSRPSLDVDPRRQRYKCWACGQHGDVIAFVQAMEKVDFREARQILANRAGIKLDEVASPQDQHRTQLIRAMKWAQERYQRCLQDHPVAANARAYLASRQLAAKTVEDFGLGFAPIAGDWLVHLGMGDKVPAEVLVEVGLIAPRLNNAGFYDRFRDRVMFPIRDVRGQCVAFGGRIMPDSPSPRAPKYYNSAETPLFRKSDVLYGLDLARHAGASVGYLAVVEGYTDVMMAHQCGVPQVVATMGTALNASHVAQLRRYVPKVVLVYDADAGGMTGVDRALEIFVSNDVELAVATLPDGLDPCDLLVRPGGADSFQQVLRGAVDALDFKLNRLLERDTAPGVEATRRIVDEVLGTMAAAPSMPSQSAQVKRELIVTRLAHRLGLRQETVWARLGELVTERRKKDQQAGGKPTPAPARGALPGRVPNADSRASAAAAPAKTDPVYVLDVTLLRLLLADPGLVPTAAAAIRRDEIQHTGIRRVVGEMYDLTEAGHHPDLDHLRDRLADRPELFASVLEQAEIGRQIPEREQKLDALIGDFRRFNAERQQKAVAQKFKAGPLNEDEAKELFRQLQQSQTRTAG